jgi:Sel1 repeat
MLRDNGTARVSVVPNPAAPREDAFLKAVQGAAAEDFTVLGEIGRGTDGVIIYLSREVASGRLVALRLQRDGSLANEFSLEVVRQLDNSMPAPESKCFKCGKAIRGWARFCSYCGADLSGAAAGEGDAAGSVAMLEAVKEAVSGDYEVLGEMSRNEGGGAVYFARDRQTNKIVALRLQREGSGEDFSVGLTTALKPLAASLGVKPVATQLLGEVVPPPAPPAPAPAAPAHGVSPPPVPPPLPPSHAGMSRRTKFILGGVGGVLVAVVAVVLALPTPQGPRPAPDPVAPPASVPPAALPPPPPPPPAVVPPPPAAAVVSPPAVSDRPKDATVVVSGLPASATLRVDGRPRTDHTLTLAPGVHALSVTASGYVSRTDTLHLRAGETQSWSPALVPEPTRPAASRPNPGAENSSRGAAEPSTKGAPAALQCQQDVDAKKWTEAADACMREALAGSVVAKRSLAELYVRGHGFDRSDENAAVWYTNGANAGDRESMYQLGIDLEHGHGVRKDEAKAIQWYVKAADAGHALAQFAVGEAYEKGKLGVPKDRAKALEWYRKSAAQGFQDAVHKVHDLSK